MKKIYLIILTFFYSILTYAQAPSIKIWDKRFGGANDETLKSFQQTSDGGFILGGYTESFPGGDVSQTSRGFEDYWIVKTDSLGNKLWDKRFGGNNRDYFQHLQQTSDGGYILGGYTVSDSSGDVSENSINGHYDFWIVKTDSHGNKQWDKKYGGSDNDYISNILQTIDGSYLLIGSTQSDSGYYISQHTRGGISDYWIIKIDSTGNKLWDKRFGGDSSEWATSAKQTSDGGLIIAGYTNSDKSGDVSQHQIGGTDFWIVKTDSVGNKVWDRRYGGTDDDFCSAIIQTDDGGYLMAGWTFSDSSGDISEHNRGIQSDFWIIKVNSQGIKQWDKRFGGNNWEIKLSDITPTNDGGYLLAGTSFSNISGDKTENNLGAEETWIVKIDSIGNKLWDKTILTPNNFGWGDDQGLAVQTNDGCYVFANFTEANIGGYKTQWSQGVYDYWMIKFCDSIFTTNLQSEIQNSNSQISLFPNPTTSTFTLQSPINSQLKIYNPLGQLIHQQIITSANQQINLSTHPKGIYYLQLTDGQKIYSDKIILQ